MAAPMKRTPTKATNAPERPLRDYLKEVSDRTGIGAIPQGFHWHLAVDTSGSAPQDLFNAGEEPAVDHSQPWSLKARSSAIFVARKQVVS